MAGLSWQDCHAAQCNGLPLVLKAQIKAMVSEGRPRPMLLASRLVRWMRSVQIVKWWSMV